MSLRADNNSHSRQFGMPTSHAIKSRPSHLRSPRPAAGRGAGGEGLIRYPRPPNSFLESTHLSKMLLVRWNLWKLKSKAARVRLRAVAKLGACKTAQAFEGLLSVRNDPDPHVRDAVAKALGEA